VALRNDFDDGIDRGLARFARAAGLAGVDPRQFDAFAAVTAAGTARQRDQPPLPRPIEAVLCDRDGTLVIDVPYNNDPERVVPLPGVRAALDLARRSGLRLGVVTNQSGVSSDRITPGQLRAVNARVATLLGPFGVILSCPHRRDAGCPCRKPQPGLVMQAAAHLGVEPAACVVIGDTISDVTAALSAGAWPILVPNGVTRPEEIEAAPMVARSFEAAVRLIVRNRGLSRSSTG
jgi:D-glycero-D-manno-heptose 1,7-bisphosphate phosphatase